MNDFLELVLLNGLIATILAVFVSILCRLIRRPALAHALWLLVLLKLVTPPLVPLAIPRPASLAAEQAVSVSDLEPLPILAPIEMHPEILAWLEQGKAEGAEGTGLPVSDPLEFEPAMVAEAPWQPSWQIALLATWLAGVLLWCSLAVGRLWRFRKLMGLTTPAPTAIHDRADALARGMGLSHCPPIFLAAAPLPPLLWALVGRARIVLPAELWHRLTTEQQDTLLAHELAHLKRRDHWVRWLEVITLALYWWHPVAWWARKQLQEAEELLCDAAVLQQLPQAADAYADALIQTVAFLSVPGLPYLARRPAWDKSKSSKGDW